MPAFGMVGSHPHHADINPSGSEDNCKHFIKSSAFEGQFSNVSSDDIYNILKTHAKRNKGGPIVSAVDILSDINGDMYEFYIESFSNSHALLTYGVINGRHEIIV